MPRSAETENITSNAYNRNGMPLRPLLGVQPPHAALSRTSKTAAILHHVVHDENRVRSRSKGMFVSASSKTAYVSSAQSAVEKNN